MNVEEMILKQGVLAIVHQNMAELSQSDQAMFAMLRRSGLGASNAAVYMGVNKWTKLEDLIEEKKSIGLTEHELMVANLENVRKGRDLEPLILNYFSKNMGVDVCKPSPMYRIIEHPQLTINFDGVINLGGTLVPVEAKYCSPFAHKYWKQERTITNLQDGKEYVCAGADIVKHIEETAELYGIPPYYYTQVQQQMLGLNAPFGYFAVIFDKGWQPAAYKIFRDKYTQDAIIAESERVWAKVKGAQ
jgi:predicted phage-related endonuclease